MAAKPIPPVPRATEAEYKILQALWRRGPATVREVWSELGSGVGYTTVLKLLQIMLAKRLVRRDDTPASHIYAAAMTEAEMQAQMVDGLIDRVFGGSAGQLVLRALAAKPVSPHELQAIRQLIAQAESRPKKL
ncbi:MAG: BlaI/MecI/CopY family transcriptional regulator [Verrucomicrobiota bacterium]